MTKHDRRIAWFNIEHQMVFIAIIAILVLVTWIVIDAERSFSSVFFVLTWSHVHFVTWALIWICFCIFALLSVKWGKLAGVMLFLAAVISGSALTKLFAYVPFWMRGDAIHTPFSIVWSIVVIVLAFWTVFAVYRNIRNTLFFGLAILGTSVSLAWQIADSFVHL